MIMIVMIAMAIIITKDMDKNQCQMITTTVL